MCVNLGVEAGGAQELLFSMGSESKEKTNIETKKSQLLLQHQKKMLFSHSESLKKIWRDLKLFKRANEFLSCGISHDMLRSMIFTVRANYHPKRKRCLVLLYHPNKHGEYARQKGINFFFFLTICAISSSEFIASDNGRVTGDNRVLPWIKQGWRRSVIRCLWGRRSQCAVDIIGGKVWKWS